MVFRKRWSRSDGGGHVGRFGSEMLGKTFWRESRELDKLDMEGEGDVRDDTQSFCMTAGAPLSWGRRVQTVQSRGS